MEQREQGWVSRSRAANGEFCLQGGSGQSCCPEGGAEKGNDPQGTEIPCSPTAGLKAVRLPPLSTLYQLLCQGCATGTSNLFKTSAVHMKHVWWCGFVSSLGKVSLFIKKTEKKQKCTNCKARAVGVAWGEVHPFPRKHFPSLKLFWVRALRFRC